MNLISEEKLQSESLKQFRTVNGQLDASFRNGARFAENELQNLAIEFVEWVNTLDAWRESTSEKWENLDGTIAHNSVGLFEVFLKQRTK